MVEAKWFNAIAVAAVAAPAAATDVAITSFRQESLLGPREKEKGVKLQTRL